MFSVSVSAKWRYVGSASAAVCHGCCLQTRRWCEQASYAREEATHDCEKIPRQSLRSSKEWCTRRISVWFSLWMYIDWYRAISWHL